MVFFRSEIVCTGSWEPLLSFRTIEFRRKDFLERKGISFRPFLGSVGTPLKCPLFIFINFVVDKKNLIIYLKYIY